MSWVPVPCQAPIGPASIRGIHSLLSGALGTTEETRVCKRMATMCSYRARPGERMPGAVRIPSLNVTLKGTVGASYELLTYSPDQSSAN
jgi:hypothetical protein